MSPRIDGQPKGVNELLADLRRASLVSSNHPYSVTSPVSYSSIVSTASSSAQPATLPPALRQILQIPETPPPPPRRPVRVDDHGRRLPPGPRPPRSWLERRDNVLRPGRRSKRDHERHLNFHKIPGTYSPDQGSLMDKLLRKMVSDWDFQSVYNRYYLPSLHSRVRSLLIEYLSLGGDRGVTVADLRSILLPAGLVDDEDAHANNADVHADAHTQSQIPGAEKFPDAEIIASLNRDVYFLDLSGSLGRSITVKELTNTLFPPALQSSSETVQDSWDVAVLPSLPQQLLPNLSHLSLAVSPSESPTVSWKQLLALAGKLPTLTHLSLAYWPEPSLTPNAKFTTVVGNQGRSYQYGGTGPYSHSLDDDWIEAIILLRKLSKSLYRLEYLDLTGCGTWFGALMQNSQGTQVDWTTDWGKIQTLRLRYGFGISEDTPLADGNELARVRSTAMQIEKHIVGQRAGKGRFIHVDRDVA
ncbi:hypothetical protein SODALDRAFT_330293 [Sodiomyces alkalinus F11]|uniref:Tafazzin n=1 Tax=Sodiomyces alkalinus (strain CBS 110278 / VKM F-3762 / F11) TaxID=1314773 RepID=A0A3N2Q1C9_SODAK|nr:hypothetical protein SODALDRAFT_330293 [Sodiomyces alkalinus F11]ROT40564.1 hypothetical protein SODALDRAFT_330293 [Sodiomyces alkalinus F11]